MSRFARCQPIRGTRFLDNGALIKLEWGHIKLAFRYRDLFCKEKLWC